jgi:hypothetical protein
MNRLLNLFLILGLVALGPNLAKAANLLGNPDLDDIAISDQTLATPTIWHVTSTRSATGAYTDGASSEAFANKFQPGGACTGSGCGLFFKPFAGTLTPTPDLVSTKLYQDVAGTAGTNYSLTGWAGAQTNYIGITDPTVKSQFGLEFYDASNTLLSSSLVDLNQLGVVNGDTAFNWKTYTVTGAAPAGTTTVRALAQMLNAYGNPAGGGQAFVVDSFSLQPVPEPACLALGLIGLLGSLGLVRRR